ERFDVDERSGESRPKERGTVCFYLDGAWHTLRLPETEGDSIADDLDVARLSEFILGPELGITDPRRDPNIDFVGGIRGIEELERLVDAGEAELAFSMYPTTIDELVAVSDAGLLMPPKSTWFEPKLRSGLLVHLFDSDWRSWWTMRFRRRVSPGSRGPGMTFWSDPRSRAVSSRRYWVTSILKCCLFARRA